MKEGRGRGGQHQQPGRQAGEGGDPARGRQAQQMHRAQQRGAQLYRALGVRGELQGGDQGLQ